MSRKQPKRRAGNLVFSTIAGIFIVAIACGVGFGVASADSSDELAQAGAFGFDAATQNATKAQASVAAQAQGTPVSYREKSVLASTSQRTIDAGLKMIDAHEEEVRQQAIAENAAAIERMEAEKAKQGVVQEPVDAVELESAGSDSSGDAAASESGDAAGAEEPASAPSGTDASAKSEEQAFEYGLPAVDWTVGQDAFVEEWTGRIDAYLEGTPLAGYGYAFAQAAWDNGVDPRWSPAISNTESSNGEVCFMPYNAWGWGGDGWSDWESAIFAHVAGLAEVYGYCITPEAAAKYCPPNSEYWYSNTISQMASI